jgi:hypothetical protein
MASFGERLGSRLAHAFNVFMNSDRNEFAAERQQFRPFYGPSTSGPSSQQYRFRPGGEKTIISSIYTRLSIDFSDVVIRHVRRDDDGRYLEDMPSALNRCLTVEANIDQPARALRQDIALTMFDRGTVAIVPVDTTEDPNVTGGWDVNSLRVGEILEWFPQHVKVNVWRDATGKREQIIVPKKFVAVVDNPLYSVMNQPNSILQRLVRKMNLLDTVDEESASGKLNIIVQLPFQVKSESRRRQASQRLEDLESQMTNNKYGVGYIDGTEKVIQLNRPSENNLMAQVEYLTDLLYITLGLTPEVMNGTADEATMINYYHRTIKPLLDAVSEAMHRTFLTRTAQTQGQAIQYFRNPFTLMPLSDIAEIANAFARNEILTSNEIRQLVGFKPSDDPRADQLNNSNMPGGPGGGPPDPTVDTGADGPPSGAPDVNGAFDQIDKALDDTFQGLGA